MKHRYGGTSNADWDVSKMKVSIDQEEYEWNFDEEMSQSDWEKFNRTVAVMFPNGSTRKNILIVDKILRYVKISKLELLLILHYICKYVDRKYEQSPGILFITKILEKECEPMLKNPITLFAEAGSEYDDDDVSLNNIQN
jgi:hypothetical protein